MGRLRCQDFCRGLVTVRSSGQYISISSIKKESHYYYYYYYIIKFWDWLQNGAMVHYSTYVSPWYGTMSVSSRSKSQLSAYTVSRTMVFVETVIWMRTSELEMSQFEPWANIKFCQKLVKPLPKSKWCSKFMMRMHWVRKNRDKTGQKARPCLNWGHKCHKRSHTGPFCQPLSAVLQAAIPTLANVHNNQRRLFWERMWSSLSVCRVIEVVYKTSKG